MICDIALAQVTVLNRLKVGYHLNELVSNLDVSAGNPNLVKPVLSESFFVIFSEVILVSHL